MRLAERGIGFLEGVGFVQEAHKETDAHTATMMEVMANVLGQLHVQLVSADNLSRLDSVTRTDAAHTGVAIRSVGDQLC